MRKGYGEGSTGVTEERGNWSREGGGGSTERNKGFREQVRERGDTAGSGDAQREVRIQCGKRCLVRGV